MAGRGILTGGGGGGARTGDSDVDKARVEGEPELPGDAAIFALPILEAGPIRALPAFEGPDSAAPPRCCTGAVDLRAVVLPLPVGNDLEGLLLLCLVILIAAVNKLHGLKIRMTMQM